LPLYIIIIVTPFDIEIKERRQRWCRGEEER